MAGLDGVDTLVLDRPVERTARVRLMGVGVVSPPADPSGPSAAAVPGDEAQALMVEQILGRGVCLEVAGEPVDRYNRLLAQVRRDDGLWLQGALLQRGLARVQTTPDGRLRAAEMLAIEATARAAGLGLWQERSFRVRTPREAEREEGFQIIEGKVLAALRRQDRWYLNFGRDWRSDFTVSVHKDRLPAFAETGLDLYGLQGRRVRVRGWLLQRNGPLIEATHPEQIEVIDAGGAG